LGKVSVKRKVPNFTQKRGESAPGEGGGGIRKIASEGTEKGKDSGKEDPKRKNREF